jgi:hypothetical protein
MLCKLIQRLKKSKTVTDAALWWILVVIVLLGECEDGQA